MNSVTGPGAPSIAIPQPSVQTNDTPAAQPLSSGNLGNDVQTNTATALPIAGNASGLLQNFVLPRTSLDALGLLKPSNQGDTEALISQVSLIAEELAADSEDALSEADGFAAAALSAIVRAIAERTAALEAENTAAQESIATNTQTVSDIDNQLGPLEAERGTISADIDSLNAQIQTLQNADPSDPEIQNLTAEVQGLTTQMNQLDSQIAGLQSEKSALLAQNAGSTAQIDQNAGLISAQAQSLQVATVVLAALRDGLRSPTESVEASQDLFAEALADQEIDDILPSMQELFEADFEDAQIQELIDETQVDDTEAAKAIAVSFGLVGSFYEALGVFMQQANMVELDLDTVARGNNESQRMQIAL